jgi:hypothetical protein
MRERVERECEREGVNGRSNVKEGGRRRKERKRTMAWPGAEI